MESYQERKERKMRIAYLRCVVKVMERGSKTEEVLLFAKKLERGLDNWDSILVEEKGLTEGDLNDCKIN
jgi:hypothetical protein